MTMELQDVTCPERCNAVPTPSAKCFGVPQALILSWRGGGGGGETPQRVPSGASPCPAPGKDTSGSWLRGVVVWGFRVAPS